MATGKAIPRARHREVMKQTRNRYITYDKFGKVTRHKTYLKARLKAWVQSIIYGVDSYIDYDDGKVIRSLAFYVGYTPFKFLIKGRL